MRSEARSRALAAGLTASSTELRTQQLEDPRLARKLTHGLLSLSDLDTYKHLIGLVEHSTMSAWFPHLDMSKGVVGLPRPHVSLIESSGSQTPRVRSCADRRRADQRRMVPHRHLQTIGLAMAYTMGLWLGSCVSMLRFRRSLPHASLLVVGPHVTGRSCTGMLCARRFVMFMSCKVVPGLPRRQ